MFYLFSSNQVTALNENILQPQKSGTTISFSEHALSKQDFRN